MACARVYGSKSSTKNHIKIKHGVEKSDVVFPSRPDA